MDESQIELAEKIFAKAKEIGGLPDEMFAQVILTPNQQNDPRRIKDVKFIIEVLVHEGLLTSEPKKNSNFIKPSPNSIHFDDYSKFLHFKKEEQEKEKIKEERDQKKYDLEIENLQLQIDTQKKWFWIAIVTAVIVEVVRIYFSWK
jgi:hypothetical protein